MTRHIGSAASSGSSAGTGPDTTAHDAAFTRWLEATLPEPPPAAQRTAELGQVQALASQRTTAGVGAATWLEVHGKKDVWKLYDHDLGETLPTKDATATKKDVKDLLAMARTIANPLDDSDRRSAPYVLDRSLGTDKHVTAEQVCPCSYPSSHAAGGAAARTYFSALAPHRAQEYRWTEEEVAYSRVYMAGHTEEIVPRTREVPPAAWGIKEALRRVLASTSLAEAEHQRMLLGTYVLGASMPETDRLWKTINAWWPAFEVLILTGVTNARTEAANTSIKHLKRTDRGFRNPDNYRARILLASAA